MGGEEGAVRAMIGDHGVHGRILRGIRIKRSNVLLVGVLLLTGFGAAMIGMMALYRLKETQVARENQILSLHLLLQGEREHGKEAERRNADLRQESYKLRDHNMELEGRISEMQEAITSLREELGSVEYALREKRNTVALLGQRYAQLQEENNRLKVVQEELRAKGDEIDDLKKQIREKGMPDAVNGTAFPEIGGEKEPLEEDLENPERRSVEDVRDRDEDLNRFLADTVNMGMQDSLQAGDSNLSGRLKWKRWREMEKRAREMSHSRDNGVAITSNQRLAESESDPGSEDGTQHENLPILGRAQNESVTASPELGIDGTDASNSTSGDSQISFDEENKDAAANISGSTVKPSDYEALARQNTDNGTNDEQGNILRHKKLPATETAQDESTSTNQQPGMDDSLMDAGPSNATVNNEELYRNVVETNGISHQEVAITNSSSGISQTSFDGGNKDATTSTVESALPDDASLKPSDHEVLLRQTTETQNTNEQGNMLGETKISHMNEHSGDGEVENHGATELGSNIYKSSPYILVENQEEDREETDEPEF